MRTPRPQTTTRIGAFRSRAHRPTRRRLDGMASSCASRSKMPTNGSVSCRPRPLNCARLYEPTGITCPDARSGRARHRSVRGARSAPVDSMSSSARVLVRTIAEQPPHSGPVPGRGQLSTRKKCRPGRQSLRSPGPFPTDHHLPDSLAPTSAPASCSSGEPAHLRLRIRPAITHLPPGSWSPTSILRPDDLKAYLYEALKLAGLQQYLMPTG